MLRLAVSGCLVVGPIREPWHWSVLVSGCRAGLPPPAAPLVCCAVPPRCCVWAPLGPSCCLGPGRGACAAADPCLTRCCGRRSLSRCPRRSRCCPFVCHRALSRCPYRPWCGSCVHRRALNLCTRYPRCCSFVHRRVPSSASCPANSPVLTLIWHCPLPPVALGHFREVRLPLCAHRCTDSLAPRP